MMKWSEMTIDQRDKLIAEKVMGLKVHTDMWGFSTIEREDCTEALTCHSYSTDMNEALLVATHERFSHAYFNHIQASHLYSCSLYYIESSEPQITTELAPKLSEAICIAALRSVGVEIEP